VVCAGYLGWGLPRGRHCRVTIRSGLPGGRGSLGSEPDLSSLSSPDVYDLYVGDKEMGVKLSDEIRRSLSEIFESRPGPHEADFFGGAYAEIT
jgi:hypothetical protein